MRPTYRLPNGLEVFYLSRGNTDYLYRELFVDRVYHCHPIEVAEGDVIFDVGANIGMFLLLLNQWYSKATVFCFEPIPEIFETLRQNAASHDRLQAHLMPCGLSHAGGSATFTYYPLSAASSTMYPDMSEQDDRDYDNAVMEVLQGKGVNVQLALPWRALLAITPTPVKRLIAGIVRRYLLRGRPVHCTLRTISDVIDGYGLDRIDLLKIDAESSESDIIRGVRADHWPLVRQIVMEVHHGEDQARQIAAFFEQRGFTVQYRQESAASVGNYSLFAKREQQTADKG